MNRWGSSEWDAALQAFVRMLPIAAQRLLRVHFLIGVSPNYVGLHDYKVAKFAWGEVPYGEVAHFVLPHHQKLPKDQRAPTIVLPALTGRGYQYKDLPGVVGHEIGHYCDFLLGEKDDFPPVTNYARANRGEAFADLFARAYWAGEWNISWAQGEFARMRGIIAALKLP